MSYKLKVLSEKKLKSINEYDTLTIWPFANYDNVKIWRANKLQYQVTYYKEPDKIWQHYIMDYNEIKNNFEGMLCKNVRKGYFYN